MEITKSGAYHYALNTHAQIHSNDKNAPYYNSWRNQGTTASRTGTDMPKGVAYSTYTKSSVNNRKVVKKPWTYAGNEFRLSIPESAYINKVTFEVRMKVTGTITVKSPTGHFNFYYGTKSVPTYMQGETGWYNGSWNYNPDKRLSNTYQNYEYVISGSEFRKRGYSAKTLNDIAMGIDLKFQDAVSQSASNTVYIQYIRVKVDYSLPNHIITFDTVTSEDYPRIVTACEEFQIVVKHQNKSNAGSGIREVLVTPPPNTEIISSSSNFNLETNIWRVNGGAKASNTLTLNVRRCAIREGKFNFKDIGSTEPIEDNIGDYDYWIYSAIPQIDDGQVSIHPNEMRKGYSNCSDGISCVDFYSRAIAIDGEVNFTVNLDTINDNNFVGDVKWIVLEGTDADVELDESTTDNTHVNFIVSSEDYVDINFRACFIPDFTGDSNVDLELGDRTFSRPYNVLPSYTYVFSNNQIDDEDICNLIINPATFVFHAHRLPSSTEIGATIFECGVADYDRVMYLNESNINAHYWDRIAYIGCVPLKYSHYDPESTFSNDLVNESYKNKVYMGKTGEIDEDITLKFKVPPRDATTLQGLVEIDKPIPVNTVPLAFEGDVLNHRGWGVLSEVKARKVNPLYYDIDAKIKYITHDIHTKFQIFKGSMISTEQMPDLLGERFGLNDSFSDLSEFLEIDTDGGYVFEEGTSEANNLFSLDEGQYLTIKTKNSLAAVSRLKFNWYTNKINENRENNLSRIFRLVDVSGDVKKTVFEYEYTNFSFEEEDFVTVDTIVRYLNSSGGWETTVNQNVDLRTEIEIEPVVIIDDDDDDEFSDEDLLDEDLENSYEGSTDDEDDEDDILPSFDPSQYDINTIYGSSVVLSLNKNILTLVDEGFNGREVSQTIELQGGEYVFETYWVNYNQDGTTEDIISFMGMSLEETILNTQYSEQYKDLIVSPFPIPNKTIVFTRESEEGTLYYLKGDEPFKYMLEPYYQYHCGTDLTTRDGISLVNLNNSYTHFYIQNGLVRLGFNKYNGELYLSKYDIQSKEYVNTHYFHMGTDTKFRLGSISDDKIEIHAGTDTVFTIWRGHPYIGVRNPTDIIYIDSPPSGVYSQQAISYIYGDFVDGQEFDYPVIYSLLNTNNMLPSCIGGKTIDYDCISLDDDVIHDGTAHSISVNDVTCYAAETTTLSVTTDATDGEVAYVIDGVEIASTEYPFTLDHIFEKEGDYRVRAVYTGDDDDNVAISDLKLIVVQPKPTPPNTHISICPKQPDLTGSYALNITSAPKEFTYMDGKQITIQLTRGTAKIPVRDMVIEKQHPNLIATSRTNSNGEVYIINNDPDYLPGTYTLGARFFNWQNDDLDTKTLFLSKLRTFVIKKANLTFLNNSNSGLVRRGTIFKIQAMGVDGAVNNIKLSYSVDGGAKKTQITNSQGKIGITMNVKGNHTITVNYAGNAKYNAISKTFRIKVV